MQAPQMQLRTVERRRKTTSGQIRRDLEVSGGEDRRKKRIKGTNLQREVPSEKYSNSRHLIPVP